MMNLIIVTAVGIALYLLMVLVKLLVKSSKVRSQNTGLLLAALETIFWTIYFFWAIELLFRMKSYYAYLFQGLLFVAFGMLVWFYLKEVVAGAFFKLQHNPKIGRYLKIHDLEGVITAIDSTHLTIEKQSGDILKIPFSRLVTTVFSLGVHKEQARNFGIVMRVEKHLRKDKLIYLVKKTLVESPYCSYKKGVEVKILEESETEYTLEVMLRPVSTAFEGRIEKKLKTVLQS